MKGRDPDAGGRCPRWCRSHLGSTLVGAECQVEGQCGGNRARPAPHDPVALPPVSSGAGSILTPGPVGDAIAWLADRSSFLKLRISRLEINRTYLKPQFSDQGECNELFR